MIVGIKPFAQRIMDALCDPAGRHRLIDEGAILFSRAVVVLVSVGTSAVTARILGPVLRGDYFYGVAICLAIAQLACLGLPSANFYFAARAPDSLRTMSLATVAFILAACALLTAAFFVLVQFSSFAPWRVSIGWPIVFAFSVAATFATSVPVFLAGLQRYIAMSAIQILSSLVGLGLVLLAARYAPTVASFTTMAFLGSLTFSVGTFFALLPRLSRGGSWIDMGFVRKWFTFAMRAIPSLVLGYLLARGTVYSARAALDPAAFGVFTIAYQIFEALINLPQTIALVMFPKITQTKMMSTSHLMKECARAAGICALIGALGIVCIVPLIPVVFGHAFASAEYILSWYFPALVAYAIVGICNQFLTAMHFPMTTNLCWAACAVITIVCTYEGGILYGGAGVAIGTSIGWVVAAILFLTVVRYEIRSLENGLGPSP